MASILCLLLLVVALPVISAVAASLRFQRIAESEPRGQAWSEVLQAGPTQLKHFSRARDMVARHGAPTTASSQGAAR